MMQGIPSSIDELDFTPKKPVFPSPADWRDHFIYFLLLDRFDNNARLKAFDGVKGEKALPVKDGIGIHGGNLAGVKRRLRYLKELGVSTIWLSPVFKNRVDAGGSLHGYAIQHFLAVDPHYGSKEELRELVDEAHILGMYIVLDIVINHTADNWAYELDKTPNFSKDGSKYPFGFWRANHSSDAFDQDDAVWPAELQDPECYTRCGAITDWYNSEQAIFGDFFNLKDLDLNNPKVLETLIAIYKYWMVEADIDGYRVDTVKHVRNDSAIKFFNSIKEYGESIGKHNFLLFGEIVDNDANTAQYVGHQASGNDRLQALDASLDFPLYFNLEEVIKGTRSPALLRTRYDSLRNTYDYSDGSNLLVTFVDNHDQMVRPYRRFLNQAFDERQAVLAMGYMLTAPGIPSIYYGTEQGFDGGGPPGDHHDNLIRECMFGGCWGAFNTTKQHFFNQNHPTYQSIAGIAHIRSNEPALRYGRFYFREVSEDGATFRYSEQGFGFLTYSRILDDEEILVVLNLRGTEYTNFVGVDTALTPPGTPMTNLLDTTQTKQLTCDEGSRSALLVTLPPYSIGIYKYVPIKE
jgi:glycosidase